MPAQPEDEWTYLRPEEFADDDAVEIVDATFESSPEEAALHEVYLDGEPDRAGSGADRTTEDATDPDVAHACYFDDEEPDGDEPSLTSGSDAEPSVDELLVSQHYAFEPDGP